MTATQLRRALAAAAATVLLGACGDGSSATAEDQLACRSLQDMATALAHKRSQDAMAALGALADRAPSANDVRLRAAGNRFVAVVFEPVANENDMTVGESVELGRLTREQGAAELGRMIDACGRLGRPIHDLPAPTTAG